MIEFFDGLKSSHQLFPIEHKLFRFPGGESHINLAGHLNSTQVAYVHGASGDDIMGLGMWADAIRRTKPNATTIAFIPYLPAARADRGTPLGAKVYADMINSFDIDRVVCVDPHSDVAPALYERLTIVHLEDLPFFHHGRGLTYDGVIIPDLGAVKRAEAVAKRMGVPTFQANKKRDFATGKLSGFVAPEGIEDDKSYLVVDDICDGGGTFLGLAQAITEANDARHPAESHWLPPTLSLWVTHGIFSNEAVPRLAGKYERILTTDSFVQGAYPHVLSRVDLLDTMYIHARSDLS